VPRLIVWDATPYGPEPSGSRRRALELMRRLPALLPDDVFEVHWARDGARAPEDLRAENLVHAVVDVSCRGGAWRWRERRRDLARRRRVAAFTHLLVDHGPVPPADGVRTWVTLHDLRFLHGWGGWHRRLYGRFAYGRLLRRAQGVVCVGASLAREAQGRYGLDPARVLTLPNAPSAAFAPGAPAAREGLLVVSRDEPRKALGAARALAGEAGLPLEVVDREEDDGRLAARYRAARYVLVPSLEEGYGLTVVEALACGTPVVASDIPAHRDHLAGGARGLVLVPPPSRSGGVWRWPGAVAALRGPPPREVVPPRDSWDETARGLAASIAAGP